MCTAIDKIVRVAKQIVFEEIHPIEGVRIICSYRGGLTPEQDEILVPLIGMESETDHFPLGHMRKNCSNEYLKKADIELECYLKSARTSFIRACEAVVRFLGREYKPIPYEFVSERVDLTWADILFAINSQLLVSDDAIQHAMDKLSLTNSFSQSLVDLASLESGQRISPYIDDLVERESSQDSLIVSNKWLFLAISWVFERREQYRDSLCVLHQILADFDCSEDLSFFRELPLFSDGLSAQGHSLEAVYQRWQELIQSLESAI